MELALFQLPAQPRAWIATQESIALTVDDHSVLSANLEKFLKLLQLSASSVAVVSTQVSILPVAARHAHQDFSLPLVLTSATNARMGSSH